MRTIGLAERTLELFSDRVLTRRAFGSVLGTKTLALWNFGSTIANKLQLTADKGAIRTDLANCRIKVDQARLLVLQAAHQMDVRGAGSPEARQAISMAKVAVPLAALEVMDLAMQAHGGIGLSHQFPLAAWYARTRTVRYMDGPDETHREVVAKLELRKQAKL